MATSPSQTPPMHEQALMDEARAWVLRLRDGDASVDDFATWQKWLATSDDHRRAYRKAEELLALVAAADLSDLWPDAAALAADDYAGEIPVADYVRGHTAAVPAKRRAAAWMKPATWAVSAMAVALFAAPAVVDIAYRMLAPVAIEVATQRAEHRQVSLRDGSTIDVGGSSDVKVDFTGPRRLINLEAGEAYFKVAPDKTRPFVVATKLGNVVAVGTQFNIRLAGDHVVVTVTEGKVKIEPGAGQKTAAGLGAVQVAAGHAAVLTQDRTAVALVTQAAPPLSWRDGRLAYRAEPMKYVIADLNRYSNRQVIIADPQIGELRYSGTLVPEAIDEWIVALPSAFPVSVKTQADGSYVVSLK